MDWPYRVYDRSAFLLQQLRRGHSLRRDTDNRRPPPFFIVGSGRSGSTLLRAILLGSRTVAIPPESYVLGPIIREYRRLSFLSWPEITRLMLSWFQFHPEFAKWDTNLRNVYKEVAGCNKAERSLAYIIDKVYREYARCNMPRATRWGDKTPMNSYHLPRIDRVFPRALYLHIIRDGRDVVASYLDAGLYDSAVRASERWLESVDLVQSFGKKLPPQRYLEVRYERLVRDTEEVIRKACGFLSLEFRASMLAHRDRIDELGDAGADHHSGLERPISDRSVGSWRDRLSKREREVVMRTLNPRLSELGYEA